jgi:hypothetical protein
VVTLSATPSDAVGTVSYQWYVGNLTPCSANSPLRGETSSQVTVVAEVSLTYVCVVLFDPGVEATATAADVVILAPALGSPSIAPENRSIDVGQSVTLSSSWKGGTAPYNASLYSTPASPCTSASTLDEVVGSSGAATNVTFPPVSPIATTSYCVVLSDASVGTPSGVTNSSRAATVTVYPDPTVSTPVPTPSARVDLGKPVTLTTSALGGSGNYTYLWSGLPSGCRSVDAARLECTPKQSGLFSNIKVTASDSDSYVAISGAATLTVNSALIVNVTGTPAPAWVDQTVTFEATSTGGTPPTTYAWAFGDGLGAATENTTHAFPRAGFYSVTLWVNDSGGGAVVTLLSLTVLVRPVLIAGLPPEVFWPLLAILVVVAVVAFAFLLWGRRSRPAAGHETAESSDARPTEDPGPPPGSGDTSATPPFGSHPSIIP